MFDRRLMFLKLTEAIYMKKTILVLILLLIPLASALDCNSVSNQQWCEDIQNSQISEEDKTYLLSDVISDKKHYPDHQLISNWNKDIPTNEAPEGVTKQSHGYIKNAWVKLLAVMPSVLLEDELLIDSSGEILTGANHNVEIPSGTASGDCKTQRYLVKNEAEISVYLNNQLIGKDNLVSYTTNTEGYTDIVAKYSVYVQTRIKHYKWKKHYNSDGGYNWKCDYYSTNYKNDNLVVEDNLNVKVTQKKPTAKFNVIDKYTETIKANFSFNDAVNVELTFLDAYFKQHNYIFSEVFSLEPLNILTIKAEKKSEKEVKNLAYNYGNVLLTSLDGCSIKLYDFFDYQFIPCDFGFTSPEFLVSLDQSVYDDTEMIEVSVVPVGEYVVEYADKKFNTTGEISLEAEYPYNRVTVISSNRIVNKLIHIKNKKPIAMFFSLGIFGLLNYVGINVLRRHFPRQS